MISKRIVTPLCDRSIKHMTHVRSSHWDWVKDEQFSNRCFLHFDFLFLLSGRKIKMRRRKGFSPHYSTDQWNMTHVRVTLDHSERSSQDTYELGQVQLKKNAQETILLCLYFFPDCYKYLVWHGNLQKYPFVPNCPTYGCNSINTKMNMNLKNMFFLPQCFR